ncbi:transglycosylase domain-containing protein [Streptomyces sp. NPDC088725]|uniref:transglycosylase domain-containing protein n=1 Tax=Streptomyces sp. NPDC088725 TaxID=3365873 RepID=UPI0037F42691
MSDEPQQQGEPEDAPQQQGKPEDEQRKRPKRTGWRRLFPTWRIMLGGFVLLAVIVVGGFIAGYKLVDIPAANAAATAQSNVYLYKDGTPIARDGETNRENIRLAQVPKTVQRAVLAAEDRGFYGEPAIDPQGMARAGWNTLTGKGTQGGSTITQQYVKNYYLGQEQTVLRKGKEFFIAIKLNREQSKSQILEGYLNTSYFGRNAYGIQAAAQAYYGKNIEDVNTAEGAYLASLLNAPSEYDVVVHPENRTAAVARWNYVLDGMVKEGWLSAGTRKTTAFPVPDTIKPNTTGLSGQRGYLVQAVKDYLTGNKIIDENTLATGGYRITTTIDRKKQDALVKAVKDQVTSKLDPDRKADKNVRVGGASIDPASSEVVAMYGGIDYTKQYVNNATRRDFQVGSTFKPFVFASAVENESETQDGERITPNTVYDGSNGRMVQGPSGPTGYSPSNEDDIDYGDITVRTATNKSVNAVYAQMAEDVGPATVRATAVALGIPKNTPDLSPTPSIALGPSTASIVDMTQAYATLANHGKHAPYSLVGKISKNGQQVKLSPHENSQAISREAADTTTSMLRSVVESDAGTGAAARSAGRPAAGKTGTAESDKAAWFAGYTPNLATVISVMGADPVTAQQKPLYGALGLARINGGGPPAQIWGQYTAAALKGAAVKDFDLELAEGADVAASPDPDPSSGDSDESEEPDEPDEPSGQAQNGGQNGGQSGGRTGGGQTGGQSQGQTGGDNGAGGQSQSPTQGQTGGQTEGSDQGQNGGDTGGGTTDGSTGGANGTGGGGDSGAGGTDTGGEGTTAGGAPPAFGP